MNIPPRDERLHDLLRTVLYGGVVRHRGWITIDGTPANMAQTLAMSTLNENGWLAWSENGEPEQCWLNHTGNTVFDAWHRELWGPTAHIPASDRPLANPVCLNDLDDLGLTPREIEKIRAGFAALDQQNRNTP